MSVVRAAFSPYRLHLLRSLVSSSGSLSDRDGFLLRLETDDGLVGHGGVAPLYWDGGESLEIAQKALEIAVHRIQNGIFDPRRFREALIDEPSGSSSDETVELVGALRRAGAISVLCGVETALLDLEGQRRGVPVAGVLAPTFSERVEVNGLAVATDADKLMEETAQLVERGYRTIKLKVGALKPEQDITRIKAIRTAASKPVRLRLDANRAWDVETAAKVLVAVAGDDIDYVEEPLRDPDHGALARLRASCEVAIAADERVRTKADIDTLATEGICDVVVIKLARVGGPSIACMLAMHARAAGLAVTFTDSIESAVGRAATVHTAASLGEETGAIGLGGSLLVERDVDGIVGPRDKPEILVQGAGLGVTIRSREEDDTEK